MPPKEQGHINKNNTVNHLSSTSMRKKLLLASFELLQQSVLNPNNPMFALQHMAMQTPYIACRNWTSLSPVPRQYWVTPGRSAWFSNVVMELWDTSLWIQHFRMSRQTLFEIADELRPYLYRKDTVMRNALSIEERVAIGVYFLASKSCYRSISLIFSRGKTTIANCAIEFCLATEHVMLNKYVTPSAYHKVMDGFERMGFPHCIGCIDGTHLAILSPKLQSAQYYNRKSYHSVVMQAVAEADGLFSSILIGHSGVSHDAHVFRSSRFYQRMNDGTFISGNPHVKYGNVDIPPLILGDGAYPLLPWLMKAYPTPSCPRERKFNRNLIRARNTVERSFGVLKSRFRRLSSRIDVQIQNINSVIAAAVVLHNICEQKKHIIPADNNVNFPVSTPINSTVAVFDDSTIPSSERNAGEAVRLAVSLHMMNNIP